VTRRPRPPSALIEDCIRGWNLSLAEPWPAAYHWVAPGRRADGTAVVLKVALFDDAELRREAEALRLFDSRGAVALLDSVEGALLLERIEPGDSLVAREDSAATEAAAMAMRRLWRPVPADTALPSIEDWGRGFARHRAAHGGGSGPLEPGRFERAGRLFAELCASQADPVVLHGDLHHGNLLRAQREPWLAIDPKGVIGEPAYEPGALLRNPTPEFLREPDVGRLTRRRLDVLADALELDRTRLRDWAFAQAVLSAVWSIEDREDGWEDAIAFAELLEEA
jgi:streptomycin 6-kinase